MLSDSQTLAHPLQVVDMPLLMEVGAHRLLRPSVVVYMLT